MIFNKIKQLKEQGRTIGITFSTFDMLHAGHIAMLAESPDMSPADAAVASPF